YLCRTSVHRRRPVRRLLPAVHPGDAAILMARRILTVCARMASRAALRPRGCGHVSVRAQPVAPCEYRSADAFALSWRHVRAVASHPIGRLYRHHRLYVWRLSDFIPFATVGHFRNGRLASADPAFSLTSLRCLTSPGDACQERLAAREVRALSRAGPGWCLFWPCWSCRANYNGYITSS